jgi:hypothetical protein
LVSVDIQPDFESKTARLVFSDNFEEEHCTWYIPIIKHGYLDRWKIEAYYPVDKYGEQVPLVNKYLSEMGYTNINEGTPVKMQETAETFSTDEGITTFDEYKTQSEKANQEMIKNAEHIKQDIMRQPGKGYRLNYGIFVDGQLNSNTWIAMYPNFEVNSAKLTISNELVYRWNEDELATFGGLKPVKDLLRKWQIQEYCICDEADMFLRFYQPLEPEEKVE